MAAGESGETVVLEGIEFKVPPPEKWTLHEIATMKSLVNEYNDEMMGMMIATVWVAVRRHRSDYTIDEAKNLSMDEFEIRSEEELLPPEEGEVDDDAQDDGSQVTDLAMDGHQPSLESSLA